MHYFYWARRRASKPAPSPRLPNILGAQPATLSASTSSGHSFVLWSFTKSKQLLTNPEHLQIALSTDLSQPRPVPCFLASAQRRVRAEDCPARAPVRPRRSSARIPHPGDGGGDGVPVSAGQLRPGGAVRTLGEGPDAAGRRGRCGRRARCGGRAELDSVYSFVPLFSSPPPWCPAVPRSCRPKEAKAARTC